MTRTPRSDGATFRLRLGFAFALLVLGAAGLVARAVELQLVDYGFLVTKGNARFSRVVETVAHRGAILDRNNEPLAISTPVDSVWANPQELATAPDEWPRLAKALKRNRAEFARRISANQKRGFLYLARHLQPEEAQKIRALAIPGVDLLREYRRYYPAGEVVGHVLGFTSIDDEGQEGAELAFDHWLAGETGRKRVIQDRMGRKVQDVESIRAARPGRDLNLSIDMRIQYLAYRELKAAIRDNRARSGSMVVMDVTTGEILAMVNQPTFNPNDRGQMKAAAYRNRAATDIIEPGSSIKPFVVAAALQSGRFDAGSVIDTNPGFIRVGTKLVQDEHPEGVLDLAGVLARSSNVGMTKIALTLQPQEIWGTLSKFGFGQVTASGFPGESAGVLTHYSNWRPVTIAPLSYGYGLSVTPLQLAQAYATLGAYGVARPVSMLRVDHEVAGEQVLDERNARTLISLLETVVSKEGTGVKASIPGYRVAGKTGTARIAVGGGYADDRHVGVFGGLAPASKPRLAAVVVIDDPGAGRYYGGDVAAPVFSAVVGGALRLMGVRPDAVRQSIEPDRVETRAVVRR
ncbi:MAG: penicillin-binding transpeptidase domain-containing protein [Steroidobacteraceae bacterium]